MPFETPYQRMQILLGYDPMSKKEEKWPLGHPPGESLNSLSLSLCAGNGIPPDVTIKIRGRVKSRGRRGKTISREGRIGLPKLTFVMTL
jgi:hypothetical protein